MTPDDPRSSIDLGKIFVDPAMFSSRGAWERAGFKVPDRYDDNKILVASHDAAPGYLFKKHMSHVDLSKQRCNYERRVEGADRVRSFVARRKLRQIVVPHKWLYALPKRFGTKKEESFVLIVERLVLLDLSASEHAYGSIDATLLKELCVVLHAFRGLDFSVTNAPFTEDGRIAFIDTERWDRRKKRDPLAAIARHLPSGTHERAEKIFEEL